MKQCTAALIVALSGFVVLPAFAASPGASPAASEVPSGPGSLNGIWINAHYLGSSSHTERERVMLTVDGKFPPLLPWAAALLEKRIKDSENGHPFANTLAQCLPGGVPLMVFGALEPIEIVESPGQVTILYQEGNRHRIILLNQNHPDYVDPSYMGDSVGHWEGDTLVVDTIGLKLITTIDQIGMPHTEKLHVIERYRRSSAQMIDINVTIDDPGTFTHSWETKGAYKMMPPGTRMGEDICENNRNPPDSEGRSGFKRF
jgi:hypothetical protein